MFVDSTLQVYTTIVAWQYYSLIWNLLVATGLVFLPIVMAIIGQAVDARSSGSTLENDSDRILSGIETRLISLFIVLFFVAMPINAIQLNPGNISTYENIVDLRSPPNVTVGTCGNTRTSYDGMPTPMSTNICETSTAVPMWWYGVLRLSHAITQTVVTEVTAQNNNAMRALTSFASGAKIESSYVRNLHNLFAGQCYGPALARYSQETSGVVNGPGTEDPGFFGRDTSWMGSDFWIDEYYADLTTSGPIPGMPFIAELNPQYDTEFALPASGKQKCDVFWAYLSDQVYAEATSPLAGDNRQGWWNKFVAGVPGLAGNAQNTLVEMYLHNTPFEAQQTMDRINALKNANTSAGGKVANAAGEVYQGAELVKLSFMAGWLTDALLKVLPILQAYFLMFIVFMLPFGLVMSGYSWDYVLQASVMIFFVIFWSAIWGFAAWIDESMARALWPGGDDGIWGAVNSLTERSYSGAMNKLIHSIVTAGTYILAPTFAGYVLAVAGYRTASYTAGQVNPGIVGTGGGSGAAGHIGRASSKGYNRGKNKLLGKK